MSEPAVPAQFDPDARQLMNDCGQVLQVREDLDCALSEAISFEGQGFPVAAVKHLAGMVPVLEGAQAAVDRIRLAAG